MVTPSLVPEGYELIQRLGAGQTAVVWLARGRNAQIVALKLPKPEALEQPVLRRMFENEVQITLRLEHPNVVRAFDGRSTGPQAFLALEYCTGGTLDLLLLERGKLPLDQALRLVSEVASGLAHAHERSVLHRDVKPANVFVSERGSAKLGDFGTGTFGADAADERVGTAFYMAPEIFAGAPASVLSDVYSLGVLAYEVIAGARPFVGDSYDALMVAHMTALPRDLRQLRPDLAREVSPVVMRAMARDPARRFATVRAFRDAFAAALGEASAATPTDDAAAADRAPAQTGRAGRQPTAAGTGAAKGSGEGQRASDEREQPERPRRRGLFGLFRRRDRSGS